MRLASHRYGKERVRVMRVIRGENGHHAIHEVEVSVSLEGEFEATYFTGDNAQVVATDTMKNTVHVLARDHLTAVPAEFALALGRHFLKRYDQIKAAEIEVEMVPWSPYRLPSGSEHEHTFVPASTGTPFSRVRATRDEVVVESGVRDVLILKSTGSAFVGYPRDEFTTLPETQDRIMATELEATWTFSRPDAQFVSVNTAILDALLRTFAEKFSPSVQNTLFLMGSAALEVAPEISSIHLSMPNKHYLPINLQPFGLPNADEIFLPTDEPHGQIEARVTR